LNRASKRTRISAAERVQPERKYRSASSPSALVIPYATAPPNTSGRTGIQSKNFVTASDAFRRTSRPRTVPEAATTCSPSASSYPRSRAMAAIILC
jgi:hypothetical protein